MRFCQATIFIGAITLSYPALAHGLTPGPAGIYFAALHILTELPAPLLLIAFGLLLGLNRHLAIIWVGLIFLLGMATGIIGILTWRLYIHPILPLQLLTVIVALFAASGIRFPRSASMVTALVIGYFLGVFFAPGPASWSTQTYAITGGIIGTCLGVFSMFLVVALTTDRWNYFWIKLALRILASWIAAIAAMVAALSFQ